MNEKKTSEKTPLVFEWKVQKVKVLFSVFSSSFAVKLTQEGMFYSA